MNQRSASQAGTSPPLRLTFDRGTVLLSGDMPDLHGVGLVGTIWDPRVAAHRTPAFRYEAVLTDLARRGLPFTDDVRSNEQAPDAWRAIELRPYQEAALLGWELAQRRGVVVLPTGSGKTRVAFAAMARTGRRALCLVPTRALLEQWHREIVKVYPGPVGLYGDGEREVAPVTISTFESAYRHMAQLGNRFDVLIVDEAHHFGAGFRDEALEMTTAGARLGLTATPPRDDEAAGRLTTLLGPVVFELAVRDLAGTFLADFELIVLSLELTPEERRAYTADMTMFRGVLTHFNALAPGSAWEDFARAAMRTPGGRAALAAFRRARKLLGFTSAKRETLGMLLRRHRDSKVLVFTADNETAYCIARSHLVMPLTCDVGRRERVDSLDRFRRGELRVLVSARVLNEGIDVPDADVAIIVGGTLGEREHVQRVGRLLRPAVGALGLPRTDALGCATRKRALVYELVSRRTIEVKQAMRRRDGLAARSSAPV